MVVVPVARGDGSRGARQHIACQQGVLVSVSARPAKRSLRRRLERVGLPSHAAVEAVVARADREAPCNPLLLVNGFCSRRSADVPIGLVIAGQADCRGRVGAVGRPDGTPTISLEGIDEPVVLAKRAQRNVFEPVGDRS